MHTKTKRRISNPDVFDILTTVSPAVKMGNMIFRSGQVAIEPKTGQLMNSSVFLTSMDDFPKVNEIYGSYFKDIPPARSTVQVAGLYKGLKVEIEAIAMINDEHGADY